MQFLYAFCLLFPAQYKYWSFPYSNMPDGFWYAFAARASSTTIKFFWVTYLPYRPMIPGAASNLQLRPRQPSMTCPSSPIWWCLKVSTLSILLIHGWCLELLISWTERMTWYQYWKKLFGWDLSFLFLLVFFHQRLRGKESIWVQRDMLKGEEMNATCNEDVIVLVQKLDIAGIKNSISSILLCLILGGNW